MGLPNTINIHGNKLHDNINKCLTELTAKKIYLLMKNFPNYWIYIP